MFVLTLPANFDHEPAEFSELAKEAGADLLEIRGDLCPNLKPFNSSLPILYSPRSENPSTALLDMAQWIDLEVHDKFEIPEGKKIIRSYHNFDLVPASDRLEEIFEQLQQAGCDEVKIACQVRDAEDLQRLHQFMMSLPLGSPATILGMGPKSWPIRARSQIRNSKTYCCLDHSTESAPGQFKIADYDDLRSESLKLCALFSAASLKSLSPIIHNSLFRRHKISAFYGQWPTNELSHDFKLLAEVGLRGYSVTSPHKIDIIAELDSVDENAKELGSVNTVTYSNGSWQGSQTDVVGFGKAYPFLRNKSVVSIVGSGGVVPALIKALLQLSVGRIELYARNENRLKDLANRFNRVEPHSLENLHRKAVSALIWALPVDDDNIRLPVLGLGSVAIDLRYQQESNFLRKAKEVGAHCFDGLDMLIYQALAQHEIFAGRLATKDDEEFLRKVIEEHGQQ